MADTISDNFLLTTERSIQLTTGTLTLQNSPSDSGYSIGPNDSNDYIKFTVGRSSNIVVKLQPQGGDLSLAVLNDQGQPILSRTATNNPNSLADAVVSDPVDPLQPGQTYYIRVSGNTSTDVNYTLSVDAQPVSQADIVWRANDPAGTNFIWRMNGVLPISADLAGPPIPQPWRMVGIADFSGDGNPDFLWHEPLSGTVAIWTMDSTSTQITGVYIQPSVGPTFNVSATSDFNGDGKVDILWREAISGVMATWFMDGTNLSGGTLVDYQPDPNWIPSTAIPNITGDGRQGLVYRNYATGDNVVWLMDGTKFAGSTNLPSRPLGWALVSSGDFNGDGQQDLLWRNFLDGSNDIWFMNGTTSLSSAALPPVSPSDYSLVGVINKTGSNDLAGNTPDTAFNIGKLDSTATYGDVVGTTDSLDFYKFNLDSPSKVSINVSGASGSNLASRVEFDVLAADGVTVVASVAANGADQKRLTDLLLDTGTYYVRGKSIATGDTRYSISLTGEEQLPVNLFFPVPVPPATTPSVVTFAKTDGTSFTSSQAQSVLTPFTFDLNYNVTYAGRQLNQFEVGFFLSKDGTLDENADLRLDINNDGVGNANDVAVINNLQPPNSRISLTQRLTLPGKDNPFWIDDGLYNIIVVLDPNKKIAEKDPTTGSPAEGDNNFAAQIRIRDARLPDLVPENFNVTQTAALKGGRVDLSGSVRNIGLASSDTGRPVGTQFEVRFYLSRDNVFDASDYQLLTTPRPVRLSPIAAGSQSSVPTGLFANLPTVADWLGYSSPQPGNLYYVLMRVDAGSIVNEYTGGAANNFAVDTITIA